MLITFATFPLKVKALFSIIQWEKIASDDYFHRKFYKQPFTVEADFTS